MAATRFLALLIVLGGFDQDGSKADNGCQIRCVKARRAYTREMCPGCVLAVSRAYSGDTRHVCDINKCVAMYPSR